MENNNSQLQNKSIAWMASRIIISIIIYGVIFGIAWKIILFLIVALTARMGVPNAPDIVFDIIDWLAPLAIAFYAVRSGFKMIIKKGRFSVERVRKVALSVIVIPIILQIGTILYRYFAVVSIFPGLTIFGQFLLWDAFLIFAVYFWGKRFAGKNN